MACLLWYASSRPRYNLLLITLDTTRADRLGCYGCPRGLTPNLDKLAARGTAFEQCRTVAPLTLPAHATIMTGLLPPEHGLRINGHHQLPEQIPTLAELLSGRGYRTAAFIASPVLAAKYGLSRGFDHYDDTISSDLSNWSAMHAAGFLSPGGLYRQGNLVADAALNWLERNHRKRFFCWVHFYDPHDPYREHTEIFGDRSFQHAYDAEIAFMDRQVGRLLTFLKQHDLAQRTLVIAVGDHGENLYDHGEATHGLTLYDTAMRVPLIVSRPGITDPSPKAKTRVTVAHVLPTALDLLGVLPESGKSLAPALRGKPIASAECYGETEQPYTGYGWAPLRAFVSDRWKFIRSPVPELYDLDRDPNEMENLAQLHPDIITQLDERLAGLEDGLQRAEAETVSLSAAERRQLESLGYAAGGPAPSDRAAADGSRDLTGLRDVKTMLPIHRKGLETQQAMSERFNQGSAVEDELFAVCRELVEKSPETGFYHQLLGNALVLRGEPEEAEDSYTTAVEIDPENAEARNNLGFLLCRRGKPEQAVEHFLAALHRNPASAQTHRNLGDAMTALGRPEQAIAHYEEALRINPDYAEVFHALVEAYGTRAMALDDGGDTKGAAACYRKALELTSSSPGILNNLARILATSPDSAVRDGNEAVRLARNACELTRWTHPVMIDTLAAAQAEAGQFDNATRTAEQAVRLAEAAGNQPMAEQIRKRQSLYKKRQPCRE